MDNNLNMIYCVTELSWRYIPSLTLSFFYLKNEGFWKVESSKRLLRNVHFWICWQWLCSCGHYQLKDNRVPTGPAPMYKMQDTVITLLIPSYLVFYLFINFFAPFTSGKLGFLVPSFHLHPSTPLHPSPWRDRRSREEFPPTLPGFNRSSTG